MSDPRLTETRRAGHGLARRHTSVTSPSTGRGIRGRIAALGRRYRELYGRLRTGEPGELVPPDAAGWLLENHHVIGGTLDSLVAILTPGFCRQLPRVRTASAGAPELRVEAIAREWVEDCGGRIDIDEVATFVQGYQEIHVLSLGELWALPAFLRLVLLEWLDDELRSLTGESRRPAHTGNGQHRVGSAIVSLRRVAAEDWRRVVEALSRVEEILRADPAGAHAGMDFRTRDRYRHAVEDVGRRLGIDEVTVARQVVELAGADAADPRRGHVGHYLVDEGRDELFRALGARPALLGTPARRRRLAAVGYFGGVAALALLLLWPAAARVAAGPALLLLALALVPAVGVAVSLVNWIVAQLVPARALPRMDFREGIPGAFRTVVAVPVMLGSVDEIEEVAHGLEVNYQANPDPALTFVLLTDFPDAPRERVPGDRQLLETAVNAVARLNRRYGDGGAGPFVMLHRTRRWNPSEGVWMGWERKRGKLAELNRLLLGGPSELWVARGDRARLAGNPFVLTLDADTLLPRTAAARLVGTLAHPLNRPEVEARGRIRRGYSVLQPRLEVLPEAEGGTPFQRVYGGVMGLDLYAHAAFDVYQDLFDEGIFAGKGIYDVAAFEASLAGRVPENALLSHDLFEGAHGRAGLVSDAVLLEDFPSHPVIHARRAHRWIRGDWQLLPWLLPRVPAEGGGRIPTPLSALSRWKILDNLRRSLQPPFLLALLVASWLLDPAGAWGWSAAVAGVLGLPLVMSAVTALIRAVRHRPRPSDLPGEVRTLRRAAGRWLLEISFLPFEARQTLDAVVRTLDRLLRTRRRLLEWTSAAWTARSVRGRGSLLRIAGHMPDGPLLATLLGGLLVLPGLDLPAGPMLAFLAFWFASPVAAWSVSRERRRRPRPSGTFPRDEARRLARRCWGYFERFQGPESHWLPPDHFQEDPNGEVAHRTSPTNIGMGMVAAVVAWDLGFLDHARFVTRIRNTADGMAGLTRYRGHFLNWYDTLTQEPLEPRYVSTVDSGNLAAAILLTREALREVRNMPVRPALRAEGVLDTVEVVREVAREEQARDGLAEEIVRELGDLAGWLRLRLAGAGPRKGPPGSLEARSWFGILGEMIGERLPGLEIRFLEFAPAGPGEGDERRATALRAWVAQLRQDVERARDELILLAPWLLAMDREGSVPVSLRELSGEDGAPLPTLSELPGRIEALEAGLAHSGAGDVPAEVRTAMARTRDTCRLLLDDLDRLDGDLDRWFRQMDFRFLYDPRRRLFRIGFSASSGEADPNHYDLLASEARIASVVAIAKGDAPISHWLHLGRPFASAPGGPVLLSWAGTMFEFLMPTIFLRTPPETLLGEAVRRAVQVQRRHGREQGAPWGISESAFHVLDHQGHYQYQAFGVPALGLRRGGGERAVIAPYASLMAMRWAPGAVRRNLARLVSAGVMGPWGPYEALDLGPSSAEGEPPRVVRAYMSHHHGMILASIGNHLTDLALVERFHRDPRVGTVEPYLHERPPWRRPLERPWAAEIRQTGRRRARKGFGSWSPSVGRLPAPAHVLSNGRLSVLLGPDGEGGSRRDDWTLVRGRRGAGAPSAGPRIVLLDRDRGRSWNPMPDPDLPEDADQRVTFLPHGAEFFRRSQGIRARMDVTVAPRADVEMRRIHLLNERDRTRRLRIAVSMEVALAPAADDRRHPAFHKLFVRSRALPDDHALLFTRRPRSPEEPTPALAVSIRTSPELQGRIRWDVDRDRFLGRGGRVDRPRALHHAPPAFPFSPHHPLDPMAGAVLDVDVEAFGELELTLFLVAGDGERETIEALRDVAPPSRREWLSLQARSRAEGELLALEAPRDEPPLWEELLAHVRTPRGRIRSAVPVGTPTDLRMSSLWRWGISGDLPYILAEVEAGENLELLESLLRAHAFWSGRGVHFDVVVLDGTAGGYLGPVRDRVRMFLAEMDREASIGRTGGIHLVPGSEVSAEDRERLRILSAVRLRRSRGDLAANLARLRAVARPRPLLLTARAVEGVVGEEDEEREPPTDGDVALELPSGFGGFDPETGDYVIRLEGERLTPAPWANVIAEGSLGFLVTESGGGFTWAEDAGEFRLTPWRNDPVLDLPGEVLYLRDDESGEVWTPTPRPLGRSEAYRIRHGWGSSRLESRLGGLVQEVEWSLHAEEPVKVIALTLRNEDTAVRQLTVTYLAEWVLGTDPSESTPRLLVDVNERLEAVLARNPFSLGFSDRWAFLASDGPLDAAATDLEGFLGGGLRVDRVPPGLERVGVGEATRPEGAGCGVVQRSLLIPPGEQRSLCFFLGVGRGEEDVARILRRAREGDPDGTGSAVAARTRWASRLGRIRIRTPDGALDRMMNGWLAYQTLSSRIQGRTGFYQSGGAFGFRDQLQDVHSLLPLDPGPAVAHLEEAAGRQFAEGDVLHWWHPGTTRGVRTRCSDDLLWLPYVLADAVRWTGDLSVLDRRVPFLAGEPLRPGVNEEYREWGVEPEAHTLLEHGLRAIRRALVLTGPRGLPLIGTGDWNDGMDRVGVEGRGESVWLCWFLIRVLADWKELAGLLGDARLEAEMDDERERLRKAVELHGWDGEWYRRAFFDDGTPLGSRQAPEAMIDSIAQSWSVISGAADPARARQAVDSACRHLIRTEDRLALLLTPPFDGDGLHPGYIAAYPPGVRENGGQYTHAAVWLVRALARLGDGARAGALLTMLLPPNRSVGWEETRRYRVEPYVVAADIYGAHPHVGRGGWTWYTGSGAWMFRVTFEDILGLRRRGDHLEVDPCVPPDWPAFEVAWELGEVELDLRVTNPEGVSSGVRRCSVNGRETAPDRIPLPSGGPLRVEILLGEGRPARRAESGSGVS